MHPLEASLTGILGSPGVLGAALVDAVTGLSYGAVGECSLVGDSIELADLANLIADRLNAAGAAGELESVVVTSGRHHHITRVLSRQGDDFLLVTVTDRQRTNLALSVQQTAEYARDVLA